MKSALLQRFLRRLKPSLLSLWGGTLLSSGLSVFISVAGMTSIPNLLWMLVLGALLITTAGIFMFLSALRLETSVAILQHLPGAVSEEDVEQLWGNIFARHGKAIVVRFMSGCALGIIGGTLLAARLFFALSLQIQNPCGK